MQYARNSIIKMKNSERGVTLFVAVMVTGLVLAIGAAILNITLKEFLLAGTIRDSSVAFYAADAGIECGKYWERSPVDGGKFDIGAPLTSITCMGTSITAGGGSANVAQVLDEMTWGPNGDLCTKVEVTKFNSGSDIAMTPTRVCPAGFTCTIIESRGYNRACADINDPRTTERAIRAIYGGCLVGYNCPEGIEEPIPYTQGIYSPPPVSVENFTSDASWNVPSGVTELTIKVWGAGGGGAGSAGASGGGGGGGGFASGVYTVTPEETLTVRIGGGGGGGNNGSNAAEGGGGGGYSGVFSNGGATPIIIAGGGGGGGGAANGTAEQGGFGGGGSGSNGSNGGDGQNDAPGEGDGGSGATTDAGGQGGSGGDGRNGGNGGDYQGGHGGNGFSSGAGACGNAGAHGGGRCGDEDNSSSDPGAGGGGGGYWGGGGGEAGNSEGAGGGGGGGGYTVGLSSVQTSTGSDGSAGGGVANAGDEHYFGGSGMGGSPGSSGTSGLVVIIYDTP